MFSKGSKSSASTPHEAPRASGATETAAPASGVPSIISADLKILGDLKSSGDVQIDGTVEGDIASRSLTVGEGGVIHGTITGEAVRIYGTIHGEVKANSVVLAKSARVEGDVVHQTISMESGASLSGRLRHLDKGVGSGAGTAAASPAAATRGSAEEPAANHSSTGGAGATHGERRPFSL